MGKLVGLCKLETSELATVAMGMEDWVEVVVSGEPEAAGGAELGFAAISQLAVVARSEVDLQQLFPDFLFGLLQGNSIKRARQAKVSQAPPPQQQPPRFPLFEFVELVFGPAPLKEIANLSNRKDR